MHVLGYMFLRMHLWDKAEKTFLAILANSPDGSPCRLSQVALAAAYLEQNEYKKALVYINEALENIPISSKNAILLLMKAKALWFENRQEEARQIVDEYVYLVAPKG